MRHKMNKKAKYALMVIMMLFILAYFAINYYTQGKYRIDFEGYTKYYAGDEIPIKVNIYKENNNNTKIASSNLKERFENVISEGVTSPHLVYDLKSGSYPAVAIDRLIERYKKHFRLS